eukprot:scaffold1127_cov361-Prasinococcus_capsulatus_cf.AAC.9
MGSPPSHAFADAASRACPREGTAMPPRRQPAPSPRTNTAGDARTMTPPRLRGSLLLHPLLLLLQLLLLLAVAPRHHLHATARQARPDVSTGADSSGSASDARPAPPRARRLDARRAADLGGLLARRRRRLRGAQALGRLDEGDGLLQLLLRRRVLLRCLALHPLLVEPASRKPAAWPTTQRAAAPRGLRPPKEAGGSALAPRLALLADLADALDGLDGGLHELTVVFLRPVTLALHLEGGVLRQPPHPVSKARRLRSAARGRPVE